MPIEIVEYGSDERYFRIKTENWACEIFERDEDPLATDSIRCCHKSAMERGEKAGCSVAYNNITFNDREPESQPANVSISQQFKVKCHRESDSKICYWVTDEDKRDWNNVDINRTLKKNAVVL